MSFGAENKKSGFFSAIFFLPLKPYLVDKIDLFFFLLLLDYSNMSKPSFMHDYRHTAKNRAWFVEG